MAQRSRFILARISWPYQIVETYPDTYNYLREVTPFAAPRDPAAPVRIALHVRAGDIYLLKNELHRRTPNDYYLTLAKKMVPVLESLGRPYVFELYTEVPTKPIEVAPSEEDKGSPYLRSGVLEPGTGRIQELDAIPHLQKFINYDAVDSICRMATADVLIIARSSFSFLAAILNPRGVILYNKFWHRPPGRWIWATNDGKFSVRRFAAQLRKTLASAAGS